MIAEPIILQFTCNGTNASNYVGTNGSVQLIQGAVCQYSDPFGIQLVGLVFWAALALALYIRSGSILLPYILTLILGSVMLSFVAPIAVSVLVPATLGVAGWIAPNLYRKYSQ